jgi:DNA-binding CsgD family transcriptional regulator
MVDPISLYRLTGGNPFFATEVLAAEGGEAGEIPATIRDAVLVRASRLSAAARQALDAAAVIGSSIDTDLLDRVCAPSLETIEECLTSGMLVAANGNGFAFRHELAREAIHGAISPPRRRELHRRILAALRAGAPSQHDFPRLAHHAESADDREAVLLYAPAAGRQAAALHAHREAAAQFARALRFARALPPAERAELLEAYAYECYLVGLVAGMVESQQEALGLWRTSGDRLREGDALRRISRFAWFAGRTGEAIVAAEQALAVFETLPPGRELAMALSNRAQLAMLAGETARAIAAGERALALAQVLDETEIFVHALNNVGTARLKAGDEQGREEVEQSLALARAAGMEAHVARAFTNLSWPAVHVRDLTRAEEYFGEGVAYTTDHDLDSWRLYMIGCRGYLRLLRGDWAAATDDAAAVLAVPDIAPISRVTALVTRGLIRARRGDPDATGPLDEALALAEATGEIQRLGPVRGARAEVAWLAGDLQRSAAEAQSVLDLALQRGSLWELGEVLLWLTRSGRRDAIDRAPDPSALPLPHFRALTGDWAGAAAAWEALGCEYDAALALLDGDEAAMRRALSICERLGARVTTALAARLLRERGARAIPRGPHARTRATPAHLTARELEILPLLAAGLRNAEIADRLFLSPKTVDHHVGHIFAKLDIHTRSDVPIAASRVGLPLVATKDRAPSPEN